MISTYIYDILNMSRKLAYNKKGYIWWAIKCIPFMDVHLKTQSCEIRCFYYLNSKVITIKNNSRIIINWDNSLFVITPPPFFFKKGKASDISNVSINIISNICSNINIVFKYFITNNQAILSLLINYLRLKINMLFYIR